MSSGFRVDDNIEVSAKRVVDSAEVSRRVGARVRELRTQRGMSMRELAPLAGLKQPFLSQLERGDAAPSMLSLYKLATALSVAPGDLLPSDEPVQGATVFRRGEGQRVRSTEAPESFSGRLMRSATGREIELSEFVIDEGENNTEWFENPYPATTYVVEGVLTIEFENTEEHVLHSGDALFYPRQIRSRWTANGRTRLLHIVAPGTSANISSVSRQR
ncbi:helix-turn-helix domain-containing protein [Subtercola endophyticus]|uniref:helix-turn-helix domain-containing protein n=1 Tax=Subtercola endophyticus TaxID=2895559 RepID=UPI001E3F62E4|nr:helix-turn-helix domain-containing protein [Subtercola endophyticus]UFS60611.1 helix-turn-helix domain-containing protein [Subtercola endophyticus]